MNRIAKLTATMGGSTFQAPVFSIAKAALEVAVIRLDSDPGRRSAKKLGE